jgi:hypothetical protein
MKSKHIVHAREKARIYRHHYRPSLNVFRVFRSILVVMISGSSFAATSVNRRK